MAAAQKEEEEIGRRRHKNTPFAAGFFVAASFGKFAGTSAAVSVSLFFQPQRRRWV